LNNYHLEKLLGILSFVLIIIISIIIFKTPSAQGYELSIYSAYPPYFWFLILLSTSIGLFIMYNQLNKSKSNWWFLGFFIIIFTNIIFLSLPLIRGYAIYPSGDALTHLGAVYNILQTGYLEITDYYPSIHIMIAIIKTFTKWSDMQVITLIYISGYLFYLLGVHLLAKVVSLNQKQTLLITILSTPLIFSYLLTSIFPFIFAIYMIPYLLYFYFSGEKGVNIIQNRILLILIALAITFLHPIVTILVILMLTGLIFTGDVYKKMSKSHLNLSKYSLRLPLIIFIVLITWYLSFIGIQRDISRVYNSLLNGIGGGVINNQLNTLSTANITLLQTFQLFFYKYGDILIYLLIFLVLSSVLFFKFIRRSKKINLNSLNFLMLAIVTMIICSSFLVFNLIIAEPIRILALPMIMVIISIGLVYYDIIGNKAVDSTRNKIYSYLMLILIISTMFIGMLNVYGSPRTVEMNLQVTNMDLSGMDWSMNYMDKNIKLSHAEITVERFEDLRLRTYEFNKLYYTKISNYASQLIFYIDQNETPSHFGYDKNYPISETFGNKDYYMIITKEGLIGINVLPENVRDKGHQYTEDDLKTLNNDYTANLIYNNGEFQGWKIYGQR